MSRAKLEIDLSALEENFGVIREKVPSAVKILCVVKADAYGHGAVQVAGRLESAGANHFGVAAADEGIELRNNGVTLPILIMGGLMPWDEAGVLWAYQLTPVISDLDGLRRLAQDCRQRNSQINAHLKIDTGMGRLGFSVNELENVVDELNAGQYIRVEGVMSHFACSEQRDSYGMAQISRFKESVSFLQSRGVFPTLLHMANSGGVCQYPEAHFNMVRVGIMLYGSYPDASLADMIRVKPVMKLVSRVAYTKVFPPQSALSYGRTFVTERETGVAYVAAGYADGVPRALSNKGSVLLHGQRCPILGRVCMDWLLVDITKVPGVTAGDEAVLMGVSGGNSITADEIAKQSGTIPYEILCAVSRRMWRTYV
jgi:alanine racemase